MSEERKPQTEDKYIIRFPDGMRERLKDAAKGNNRTMNAEIVARLEETITRQQTSNGIPNEVAMYIAALENKALMLGMRADMLKMRLDSIRSRVLLVSQKAAGLDMSSLTDAELEGMEAAMNELREAEVEIDAIHGELEAIQDERQEVLQSIRAVRSRVSTQVVELEKALAVAAARSLKNPSDH